MDVSPAQQFAGLLDPCAISPERTTCIIGVRDGVRQVYLRALDSSEAKPITSTEAPTAPTLSPDGRLAFFSTDAELKKIPVQIGSPVNCSEGWWSLRAAWGGDGTIVILAWCPGAAKGSSAGGPPKFVTRGLDQRRNARWPVFCRAAKAFLFVIEKGSGPDDSQIAVQRLDTGQRQIVVQGGTFPQCVSEERLVFVHRGTLLAVPFDVDKLQVKGTAIAVGEHVRESGYGAAQFGISPQGSLVYVAAPGGVQAAERRLMWVSRNGTEQSLAFPARDYQAPRLSPDGRIVAVAIEDQVWLIDLSRETLTRLTFEGENGNPSRTPYGKRITFQSNETNLFWWQMAVVGGNG